MIPVVISFNVKGESTIRFRLHDWNGIIVVIIDTENRNQNRNRYKNPEKSERKSRYGMYVCCCCCCCCCCYYYCYCVIDGRFVASLWRSDGVRVRYAFVLFERWKERKEKKIKRNEKKGRIRVCGGVNYRKITRKRELVCTYGVWLCGVDRYRYRSIIIIILPRCCVFALFAASCSTQYSAAALHA